MEEFTIFGKDIVLLNPEFLQFKWLLLGLFVLTSIFFVWRWGVKPKATFGSKYPWLNSFAFWAATVIVSGAVVIALTRPVTRDEVVVDHESVDVAVAIDNSLSMRAADMGGDLTRLSVAKREALTLLQEEALRKGDRAGLFVFGKSSFLPMPLTTDLSAFGRSVSDVSFPEESLGNETVWGTNLPIALQHVYEILDKQEQFAEDFGFEIGSEDRPIILFVLTDGDNEVADDELFKGSLDELRARGVRVYPIGIGTREGVTWTSLLRGYQEGEDYPSGYTEGWEGQRTRLETQILSRMASATGGEMHTLTNGSQSALSFMGDVIDANRSSAATPVVNAENKMEFWWYITLGAVVLLMIAILII